MSVRDNVAAIESLRFAEQAADPSGASIAANFASIYRKVDGFYVIDENSVVSMLVQAPDAATPQTIMQVGELSNTLIGDQTGEASTLQGTNNTTYGQFAGFTFGFADDNTLIGWSAGKLIDDGSQNVAVGSEALSSMVTNSGCVAIGYRALKLATNVNNIGIGSGAGAAITTGTYSVLIGFGAGAALTTEDNNVFIGRQAGQSATASNRLYIDVSNTATPLFYGEFDNRIVTINGKLAGGSTAPTNTTNVASDNGYTFKESGTPTADTDWGKLYTNSNNELRFQDGDGANHLVHADAFSSLWFHNPTVDVITIGTEDAFIQIDSFENVGDEDDLTNVVGSAGTDNLTLSANAGGDYNVEYSMSITAVGANRLMVFCPGVTLGIPKDITNVTDDLVTPIVITSTAHGFKNGDMVQIADVLVNTAANGSFVVANKADNTFEIVALDGTATTGNGDYDEGTPTGDITIWYPGTLVAKKEVSTTKLGVLANAEQVALLANDVVGLYVANVDAATDLSVLAVSMSIKRGGD